MFPKICACNTNISYNYNVGKNNINNLSEINIQQYISLGVCNVYFKNKLKFENLSICTLCNAFDHGHYWNWAYFDSTLWEPLFW